MLPATCRNAIHKTWWYMMFVKLTRILHISRRKYKAHHKVGFHHIITWHARMLWSRLSCNAILCSTKIHILSKFAGDTVWQIYERHFSFHTSWWCLLFMPDIFTCFDVREFCGEENVIISARCMDNLWKGDNRHMIWQTSKMRGEKRSHVPLQIIIWSWTLLKEI